MEEEKKLDGKELIVRILSAIFALILLVFLVFYKLNHPDFKIYVVLVIGTLIILFFVGIIIGFHYLNKKKEAIEENKASEKLPKPISKGECIVLAKNTIKRDYADYTTLQGEIKNQLRGKDIKSYVCCINLKGVYTPDIYNVIFNRHFPDETINTLLNADDTKINRVMNLVASHPEETPDIETIERENPLLGTTEKITKVTKKQEKESKKKEEEEL